MQINLPNTLKKTQNIWAWRVWIWTVLVLQNALSSSFVCDISCKPYATAGWLSRNKNHLENFQSVISFQSFSDTQSTLYWNSVVAGWEVSQEFSEILISNLMSDSYLLERGAEVLSTGGYLIFPSCPSPLSRFCSLPCRAKKNVFSWCHGVRGVRISLFF